MYSHFEPFHCNKAIPCFDQPNLRATLDLTVYVPDQEWVTIMNEKEIKSVQLGEDSEFESSIPNHEEWTRIYPNGGKIFKYAKTKPFPTYIFEFAVGPYACVSEERSIPGHEEKINFRVFSRRSIREDLERVASITINAINWGIAWYSDYFGVDYPWSKLDQLYCPEFKINAMENFGIITYGEQMMARGQHLTETELIKLNNVILHELCHHWFGNLVTMQWWDDLWLKEAFATFVSFVAMDFIGDYKTTLPNTWVNMSFYKSRGYKEGAYQSTHPIIKDAIHTDSVVDMFNGITYGKGCAFVLQLHFIIGHENFGKACKLYFEKNSWGVTNLNDFIDCVDQVCP